MEYKWDLLKLKNDYNSILFMLRGNLSKVERIKYLEYKALYLELFSYFDIIDGLKVDERRDISNLKREINVVKGLNNKFTDLCLMMLEDFLKDYIVIDNNADFTYLPTGESLKLVKEFYQQLDMEFYNEIKNILSPKSHLLYLSDDMYVDDACYDNGFKENPYIIIYNEKTIMTPLTVTHELGHAINFYMNINNLVDPDNINDTLCEVTSMFMELLFWDFLSKKGINPSQVNLAMVEMFDNRLNGFMDLNEMLMAKRLNKQKINHFVRSEYLEIDDKIDVLFSLRYLVSFTVALKLHEQYLEDEWLALYNLKELIRSDKKTNFYSILEDSSINIFDFDRTIKVFRKRMDSIIKNS